MGYCHCSSCRKWSASPVNAFTLWKPDSVKVVKGADQIGVFNGTDNSFRKWCKRCGGHLMNEHPKWGVIDVYAATIPDFPFRAGVHVNYQETLLRMDDGAPNRRISPPRWVARTPCSRPSTFPLPAVRGEGRGEGPSNEPRRPDRRNGALLTTCGHSPPEPPAGMGRLVIKCCELVGGAPATPDCRPNRALDKATVLVDGAERGTCKNWRGDGAILATGRHVIQVRVPLGRPSRRG